MTPSQNKVLDTLQRLCARREMCRSDVLAKALRSLDGDRAAAAGVVDALVEGKWVDDRRYAAAFAREKAALQGWGSVKISHMLAAKGIDRQTIATALEEVDPDASERKMRAVLETKARSLRDDPQQRLKLLRFGLGRGYDYDSLREAVEQILGGLRNNP